MEPQPKPEQIRKSRPLGLETTEDGSPDTCAPAMAAHGSNVLELLRPGSFVRLRNQPADLPPFQLIHCRGGRCWVRQQAWGALVQWEVAHGHLTTAA
jgi:hypothetical protein